jgi:hypothetical protein
MGALRDFVADMLEIEGAAIEPVEPDGLEVLASEPLRAAMGWPEFARLGFAATLPVGAIPIGLEGDWLDRFGTLLGERGRFAERQLVVAGNIAAPSDPQRLLDRALERRVLDWHRVVEDDHHTVACVTLKGAAVFDYDFSDGRVIVAQQCNHIFRV